MLHEILLSLSGHPSPLFPSSLKHDTSNRTVDGDFPLLSPSETALLESVGKLADLHRRTRTHAQSITSDHPSVICRAVASSVLHVHLARFQNKILDVERQILTKDATLVGAYNIVPLSAVVGEFDEWTRRMEWYWRLVCYIQGASDASTATRSTGAALIDHLRAEALTGYPDIEVTATELSCVAEKAWLKQLSVWLLFGEMPSHGASDFFVAVQEADDEEGSDGYVLSQTLLPRFVSSSTAGSLVFIGKSLNQVKRHRKESSQQESADEARLVTEHLQLLSALSLPLVPSTFSTTISRIRSSLSRSVLQKLLPAKDIQLALNTFRQFFLLERGEFATTLIWEAQAQLEARNGDLGRFTHDDPRRAIQSVLVKDGEVAETLARTWKTLSIAQSEDLSDEVLEHARENIRLETSKQIDPHVPAAISEDETHTPQLSTVVFNDMLFPIPTTLTMPIRSPLDLFISRADVARYATINAYLISLRRSHTRLADLWRLSPARREDPNADATTRARSRARVSAMRKVWATCSAAVFLVSETTAYFEGEVIRESWEHFMGWVTRGRTPHHDEQQQSHQNNKNDEEGRRGGLEGDDHPHDPESLASAHRLYLSHLTHALLLTDVKYTTSLRTLLSHIESLAANIARLQHSQRMLDLDTANGVTSAFAVQEESRVALEVDRGRKRVDGGLKEVVGRLRRVDGERSGDGGVFGGRRTGRGGHEGDGKGGVGEVFEVWRGGGVERLLMKLDFGRVSEGEYD